MRLKSIGMSGSNILVSIFVLYHVVAILHNSMPETAFTKPFLRQLDSSFNLAEYMRATSNEQIWHMFSPNPPKQNIFTRILVRPAQGASEIDLRHDIYLKRDYPYLFYDRRDKINRSLFTTNRYRAVYAAWVCRDWALAHKGVSPFSVRLQKFWTGIPSPHAAIATLGFAPGELELTYGQSYTFYCDQMESAILPDDIRFRHGLLHSQG